MLFCNKKFLFNVSEKLWNKSIRNICIFFYIIKHITYINSDLVKNKLDYIVIKKVLSASLI